MSQTHGCGSIGLTIHGPPLPVSLSVFGTDLRVWRAYPYQKPEVVDPSAEVGGHSQVAVTRPCLAVMMRDLTTVHAIAREHRGLVTRALLLEAGASRDTLLHLRRAGAVEPVQPGVWRLVGAPSNDRQAILAALLAAGPGAAVSHRAAARVLGLTGQAGMGQASTDIDITVPRPRHPRLRFVQVHRSLDLVRSHTRVHEDLVITSVERTLADLGDVVPRRQVAWAVERAIIERRTTISKVWELLDELGRQGRNGRGALREALEGWLFNGRQPDSVLEIMLARVVRQFGLPEPEYQAEIRRGGVFVARVDACWRPQRMVAEVDGLHAHATAAQLQHDLRRQNELVALGYRVLRFTWPDVVRSPAGVAMVLDRELRRSDAA
jgi:very-short-patch-repair endonuclease